MGPYWGRDTTPTPTSNIHRFWISATITQLHPRLQDPKTKPPNRHSKKHRPSTPLKYTADGRTMPSENHARHTKPPSKQQQEEAEETARDILGPRIISLPTVQFILKLQATRMDPMEWVSVKQVIKKEPKAGKSLFLLAKLLDQDAKARAEEEHEMEAAILQADELHQMLVKKWREARRRAEGRSY